MIYIYTYIYHSCWSQKRVWTFLLRQALVSQKGLLNAGGNALALPQGCAGTLPRLWFRLGHDAWLDLRLSDWREMLYSTLVGFGDHRNVTTLLVAGFQYFSSPHFNHMDNDPRWWAYFENMGLKPPKRFVWDEGLPQSWWQGISHVPMTVVGFRIHPSPIIVLGFLSILLDTYCMLTWNNLLLKDVDILRYV